MKKIVFILLSLFFLPIVVNANSLSKEIWNKEVYRGVTDLIYIDKFTNLYEYKDNYLLEFRYEKDDIYYALVLIDKDGNVIKNKYFISSNSDERHQLYYYKDRIYLIDADSSNSNIMVFDDRLNELNTESEYGADDLTVPIYDVTFYKDNIYVFYRSNSGGEPTTYNFYVYQYDLDGKFIESFSYEYISEHRFLDGEEVLSDEDYEKQLYFYDTDKKESLTFNYDSKEFEFVDYTVSNRESYSTILSPFCETGYLCDYRKVGKFYYIDKHKVTYTFGDVIVKDEELKDLFQFKNYVTHRDNLVSANDKYFVYTTGSQEEDSPSKIYNSSLNKLEEIDVKNTILSRIYNNDLFVVVYKDGIIKMSRYDLAYDVMVGSSVNGTIGVNKTSNMAGEEVVISNVSSDGYKIKELNVVDSDGDEIKVVDNKFIMPESDVFISATYEIDNPNTSDFLVKSIFIIFVCVCIIVYVKKNMWKEE